MLKKVADLTASDFKQALNTNRNIFSLTKSETPNCMDVVLNYDGSMQKRLGTDTKNSLIIASSAGPGFSPNSASFLNTGLIAFWPLNEASGTRNDAFGSNHLTDNNGVGQSGGINKQAALFTAANSTYLLKDNTSSLSTGDIDFFMSSWFYLNSTSTTIERTIISKRDNGTDTDVGLLLHMDGVNGTTAFTDSSINNRAITANGDAKISTAQSVFGGASGSFDGTGDYLSYTANALLDDFGTSDFTVDFRVRFSAVNQNHGIIYSSSSDGTSSGQSDWVRILWNNGASQLQVILESSQYNFPWSPSANTWYHVAVTRQGTNLRSFIDGVQIGTAGIGSDNIVQAGNPRIGRSDFNLELNGFLDEFRMIKGRAAWTSTFVVPAAAYTNPGNPTNYEYWLYVNTDNIVTFRVSSSGTSADGTVRATSLGAITTSTWYNAVAWHDTGDTLGISVNLSVNTASYASGLRIGSAPFVIGAISNGTTAFFDGRIDDTGFWKRVPAAQQRIDLYNSGTGNTYQTAFGPEPWASFDFGASGSLRWLMCAAGTGIYASSNLGVTWLNVATDRTASYQYFERSKNVLIATSESYDSPLYWTGSAAAFMAIVNSNAPLCKYAINFQGYLILLNSNQQKRGFFFEDENTQLTGTWSTSFNIPSSLDDEVTGAFILKKRLFISTRYKLYNITFVGGNPVWEFKEVKDWGFVPRTPKRLFLKEAGEVVVGMDWARKIRIFDASDDKIASDNIEFDNGMCDFAMSKVSYAGSGPIISFAEVDANRNVYKLCVAIGENSTQTTHFINFDGRIMGFYPESNRQFNTMTMAESANRRFMMAFDRSGFCHLMDSGNQDGRKVAINEIYDSPFTYAKSPSQLQKGHKIDLFFGNTTSGRLYFYDRSDFNDTFRQKDTFILNGTGKEVAIMKSFDIPQTFNAYQWRLSSSGGTSDPWTLFRDDLFEQELGIGKSK